MIVNKNLAINCKYHSIYYGTVFHTRFFPRYHSFSYRIYMLMIDLDHIDTLTSLLKSLRLWFWQPICFNPNDYLPVKQGLKQGKPRTNGLALKASVIKKAQQLGAKESISQVKALVNPRCWGMYFSPVNFYYCYGESLVANGLANADSLELKYVLAEVTNTPWLEKYYYLIDAKQANFRHPKSFHVSPFQNLDMEYRWTLKPPTSVLQLTIDSWQFDKTKDNKPTADNQNPSNWQKLFYAGINLQQQELSSNKLRSNLLRIPSATLHIVLRIYWQALRLWFKSIPLYAHPGRSNRKS